MQRARVMLKFLSCLPWIAFASSPAKKIKASSKLVDANPVTVASPLRITFDVASLVGEPSEASFTLQVHPEWAPLGAKRLQDLVEAQFFDGVRFFRVIDGFMAQFGIHGEPATMHQWSDKKLRDDPKVQGVGNTRGRVSFAMAGANTRTTQLFINFGNNNGLDGMGFTPIAEIVEGMDVVDRIYKVGEGAPSGPGPSQGQIQAKGNAYLNERFPRLSYVKSCRPGATGAKHDVVAGFAPLVVQDLGNGLKLQVTEYGDGTTFPQPGDRLTMHYELTLPGDASRKVIDSSRSRGEPFVFIMGRGEVIQGWDIGIMKMSLGERGTLTVPSALGYGAVGGGSDIPPNTALNFDVEVLGINTEYSAAGMDAAPSTGPLTLLAIVVGAPVLLFLAYHLACRGGKSLRTDIEFGQLRMGKPSVD